MELDEFFKANERVDLYLQIQLENALAKRSTVALSAALNHCASLLKGSEKQRESAFIECQLSADKSAVESRNFESRCKQIAQAAEVSV